MKRLIQGGRSELEGGRSELEGEGMAQLLFGGNAVGMNMHRRWRANSEVLASAGPAPEGWTHEPLYPRARKVGAATEQPRHVVVGPTLAPPGFTAWHLLLVVVAVDAHGSTQACDALDRSVRFGKHNRFSIGSSFPCVHFNSSSSFCESAFQFSRNTRRALFLLQQKVSLAACNLIITRWATIEQRLLVVHAAHDGLIEQWSCPAACQRKWPRLCTCHVWLIIK